MGLHEFTFYDLIKRNATCFNSNLAWLEVERDLSISFAEYKDHVDRLSYGLQLIGIRKGDRIGVIGQNCFEYFVLLGAAAAIGAILLPINWRLVNEEIIYNLNDCEPVILFVGEEYQTAVDTFQSELPYLMAIYSLDNRNGIFKPFKDLLSNSGAVIPAKLSSDDGLLIIHTAAVTGHPKGALLSHKNVLSANICLNSLINLKHCDTHLNLLPLFHIAGLCMVTNSFHNGALNVNLKKFDAKRAVGIIEERGVTIIMEFSPMLSSILDEHESSQKSISTLKSIVGIEEHDTIERYLRLTKGQFYCIYGQTETSCLASIGNYLEQPGSAGRPVPIGEVCTVDEYDEKLENGQVGEIVVRGPVVFQGYWNLPKENEYIFRNGWLHTGDYGRIDENGFLWFEGRKPEKDLIKSGGENVYPAEVENIILKHPSVTEAVVFGVPDKKWKEAVTAVCRLRQGENLKEEELIGFIGEKLARYKKPRYILFVDSMPITSDGSVDRKKVIQNYGRIS